MSIYFTNPIWLLLAIPALAAILYSRRRSLVELSAKRQALLLASRCVICLAPLLALAGLTLATASRDRETVYLIDTSASVDSGAAEKVDSFIQRANVPNAKRIYFAGGTSPNSPDALTESQRNETNLESALFTAYAAADPTRKSQIVLFSDGVETSGELANALHETRVPVSVCPLETSKAERLQLARLTAPESARQGAPFEVEAVVQSVSETRGVISVYANGALVSRREETIAAGENRFPFSVTASSKDKELEISAILESEEEIAVGADAARAFVSLDGKPKILVIAKEPDALRNFTSALRAQDFEVEARPLEGLPETALEMEPFDGIVLADVSATSLSTRQLESLGEYARDFGGGLVVIGGENSFGAGGYGHTELDALLPVASDFEKEKEKPSLAVALVVDRSGSMDGDKMELTKKAAQGVVELLSPQDVISVIAFDDAPREVVPIQNVTSPAALNETIGAISADGATNIYPALAKATDDLLRVNAKFKHIILLSDGLSVPGEYEQTIRRAVGGKITVSTVGIGTDADRFLLEKIASEGAGRSYFCDDPRSVPQIFARETRLADRSAVSEEPFLVFEENSSAKILGDISLEEAPPLLGNAVVRAKPTAQVALTTERGEPLMAFWRYGLGTTVAFMSDADGRWSAEWLDWPDFSRFWAQVARFAMRQSDASNARVSVDVRGGRATLRVDARDRFDRFLNGCDVKAAVVDANGARSEITAVQRAPGLYEASFPTRTGIKYAAAVTATQGDETLFTASRAFIAEKSRETDVRATDEETLREIARATGGVYNPAPEDIANAEIPFEPKRAFPLRSFLLCLALFTFAADVYLRRID
ncbi:MAG: VWA domain-containing protein [Thermoguttaceae bacterium]|nr:VWA domain-containing protein [Thermoguttaceae bacterium]